jgi:hypothetical protein
MPGAAATTGCAVMKPLTLVLVIYQRSRADLGNTCTAINSAPMRRQIFSPAESQAGQSSQSYVRGATLAMISAMAKRLAMHVFLDQRCTVGYCSSF